MASRKTMPSRKLPMIVLDRELADQLDRYMQSENYAPTQFSEAIRGLLRIAMAATPMDGAMYAVRMRAFNEVRTWMIKRVMIDLKVLQDELKTTLGLETGATG